MTDELHVIDASNDSSLELLELAYRQIYEPAVAPENREPLEDWIELLRGESDTVGMVIVIAGEGFEYDDPVIKGLTTGVHFKGYDSNLIGYTLADPFLSGQQRTDMLRAMVNQTASELRGMAQAYGGMADSPFIELDDPQAIGPVADRLAAQERVDLFAAIGAKTVNVNYVAPACSEEGQKNTSMKLVCYPGYKGEFASRQQVKDLFMGIYDANADFAPYPIEKDPDLKAMMRQVDTADSLYADTKGTTVKFSFKI